MVAPQTRGPAIPTGNQLQLHFDAHVQQGRMNEGTSEKGLKVVASSLAFV